MVGAGRRRAAAPAFRRSRRPRGGRSMRRTRRQDGAAGRRPARASTGRHRARTAPPGAREPDAPEAHGRARPADAAGWALPARFDAVPLDAPCTATGTLRRHPDILHLKRPSDSTSSPLAGAAAPRRGRAGATRRPSSTAPARSSRPRARTKSRASSMAPPGSRACRSPPRRSAANRTGSRPPATCAMPFHMQRPEPGLSGLDGFARRGSVGSGKERPQLPPRSPCLGRRPGLLGPDVGLPSRAGPLHALPGGGVRGTAGASRSACASRGSRPTARGVRSCRGRSARPCCAGATARCRRGSR